MSPRHDTVSYPAPAVLRDGHWVNRNGVQVWVANPPPTPEELARAKADRDALRERAKKTARPVPTMSPDAAICAAALEFGIHPAEITLETRDYPYVDARGIAMWLLRKAGYSYPRIANLLDRDHTTVIYNVRRVRRNTDLLAIAHRIHTRLTAEDAA